ncbi:MAG: hypothetical protein ABEK36_00470 [Candidatus Aenigmatarchaeota archaeon]
MGEEISKFENYLSTNKVKEGKPDPSKAKGLMEMAKNDSEKVKGEPIEKDSTSYVFKNAYDVIRSALTSFMALEGYNLYSHTAVLAYARDKLGVKKPKISKLNKFRKLRNNIEYRAERATEKETREIMEFMEEIIRESGGRLEKRLKDR